MHIKLLGTGSIWAKELGACALVNNKVLIDCPNGLIKRCRREKIDIKAIDLCIITHFHADHYFDIPFLLLEQGMHNIRKKKFVIIGPNGVRRKVCDLFNMAYPELWEKVKVDSKLEFIETNDSAEPIICGEYTIIPYKVNHNSTQSYGYVIEDGFNQVGFSGDTIFCDNVERIIEKSEIVFLDMSFEKNSKAHMGVNNMIQLKKKYLDCCKIVPTHMSDDARYAYNEIMGNAPQDGTDFYI